MRRRQSTWEQIPAVKQFRTNYPKPANNFGRIQKLLAKLLAIGFPNFLILYCTCS
jgi:hypothetical protein